MILNLDKETRVEIIKDLFNESEGANLVPYGGSSSFKADLWQNIDSNRIIIKIEDNVEIKDFELIHDAYDRYESIINTEPPQHFILIVLRNIAQETKNRVAERFGRSKALKTTIIDLDDLEKLLSKYSDIERKYFGVISSWHEVYLHIAEILNKYYIKNPNSPSQSFYKKIRNSKFIELNKDRIYQYDPNENPEGLDPVQVFACFNYTKINIKTRVQTINALLEAIGSGRRVNEETDFKGIPAPIITQIKYNRKIEIQNEIWEFFSRVYIGKLDGLTQKDFSGLNNWRGLQIPSLTMFLFWIDSENFLPLDTNTVKYLINLRLLSKRPKNYEEYKALCSKRNNLIKILPLSGSKEVFRNIVKEAYGVYEEKSNDFAVSGTTQSFVYSETGTNEDQTEIKERVIKQRAEQFKGFKIVAIRPKAKENRKSESDRQLHIKNLKEGQIYQFYKAYYFDNFNDNEIAYDSSLDSEIFNEGDLNISISAVVGMNGSGKSTIADFLYLIINKISFGKKIKSTQKLINEDVYADIFIKSDKFYKISVGEEIRLFTYDYDEKNKKYINITDESKSVSAFRKFDIEALCYSIVVNYSLYSLNSNFVRNWINPLFHKNDSYQVPIVLNPKRENGKIDVNIEDGLAKSRLLVNLLEPNLIDFDNKIVPALIPGSIPKQLKIELNHQKLIEKRKKYKRNLDKNKIELVIHAFKLNIRENVEFLDEAKEHIYLKTISIAYNYPKFKNYKKLPEWINDANKLEEYVKKLIDETSHITFKLKQSINYLVYDLYNTSGENNVIDLSKKILDFQRDYSGENDLRTIDLIPPSFLKTNVIFEHGGNFDSLSSGEKQQIYSINTIAYHLYNLKSVMVYENIYKYSSVNIIFDEVELYFHPDMQRKYVCNLRERIISLNLNKNKDINNINIIFITHSPFILSDIPKCNILMLKREKDTNLSLPDVNDTETFGANVHDLLANEFFMENGFMGEFAKQKINDLILHLTEEKSKSNWDKDSARNFIEIIGEPYLKGDLLDLYHNKYLITQNDIDEEIELLKKKKLSK
jgi:energy-coupling factor transporter ATP-binding protein EcfA2